ncbi:DUF1918 domain-containing protein [Streptomyces sp. E-08]|uniref:DUF1918 domain-containing protein n=1 Tax=Streptomyces sp. E-08 TaxID=3404047 RepID=UPI003CF10713
MQASVGDRYIGKSRMVGQDRVGEIIEVKGPDGMPPYLVRFTDGNESLVNPGPTDVIQPAGTQN